MTFFNDSIQFTYLMLIIFVVVLLILLLIIFQFSRQKYENRLKKIQDEAILKLKALNEKIELNHSAYEGQINSLNTANRQLEEEKKLIRETLEDKVNSIERHLKETKKHIKENYELKFDNLSEIYDEKEKKLLDEFEIKEKSFQEKIALLEKFNKTLSINFEDKMNYFFKENQENLNKIYSCIKSELPKVEDTIKEITSPKILGDEDIKLK